MTVLNSTEVRLGGDSSGLVVRWTTVPASAFAGGFTTDASNPLQYSVLDLPGGKVCVFQGRLIVPATRPTAATTAVTASGFPTPAYRHQPQMAVNARAGYGGVGRRSNFLIDFSAGLYWLTTGTDVAGESIDMTALPGLRVV